MKNLNIILHEAARRAAPPKDSYIFVLCEILRKMNKQDDDGDSGRKNERNSAD